MSGHADDLVIRVAQPDDHQQLEDLQRRASLALPEYRADLEAHPDAIHLPPAQLANGQVLVAEVDGRVAGFAAVVGGELDGLFVEPEQWRRGIGTALVNQATLSARERGLSLTVIAGPEAEAFYARCGFTPEEQVATRFGPAVRMSR